MHKYIRFALAIVFAAAMTGCVSTGPRFPQSGAQIGSVAQVEPGIVQAVRVVQTQEAATYGGYVGGAIGATGGAALGSKVGKGKGKQVATVLGGIIGGAAGTAIGNAPTVRTALEIQVRLDNGRTIAVTQGPEELFRPGQRVHVIYQSGSARVAS